MAKKHKLVKVVLGTLFSGCLIAGAAVGLSACGEDAVTPTNDEIYAIYNLYVANADDGEEVLSYEEWLESIKGEQGAQGPAGQNGQDGATWLTGTTAPDAAAGSDGDLYLDVSTFTVYIKAQGVWTTVGTIKGEQGAQGPAGADGEDGATGPQGPAGEDGADGLTPYIGKNGNWWIGEKDTGIQAQGPAGADGEDGATGPQGPAGADGEQGEQGEQGVSIVDVGISYEYEADGSEYMVFTIYYSEGEPQEIKVAIPVRVTEIMFDSSSQISLCEEGVMPELYIYVTYANGTGERVRVTQDMFVTGETGEFDIPNFAAAGEYWCCISYRGCTTSTNLSVYDPNDASITSIAATYDRVAVLVDGEGNMLTPAFSHNSIRVIRANLTEESISFSDERIKVVYIPETISAGSNDYATVKYTEGEYAFECKIELYAFTQEMVAGEPGMINNVAIITEDGFAENGFICETGGSPFTDGDYLQYDINGYYYGQQITADMLVSVEDESQFDNTQTGEWNYKFNPEYTFNIDLYEQCGICVYVTVYDPETVEVTGMYLEDSAIKIGAVDLSGLYARVEFSIGAPKKVSLAEMEISGDYDLNTAGRYTVTATYNGYTAPLEVTVYDPEVCNISYISMGNTQPIMYSYDAGSDVEAFLEENVLGKQLHVGFYEPVNGATQSYVTITRDMVDATGLDTAAGYMYITISYGLEGQEKVSIYPNVYINVDMSGASIEKSYAVAPEINTVFPYITSFDLYDNGYVPLTLLADDTFAYGRYTVDGDIITVKFIDHTLYYRIYTDENQQQYAGIYQPEGSPSATYVNDDINLAIEVYDGYVVLGQILDDTGEFIPAFCLPNTIDSQTNSIVLSLMNMAPVTCYLINSDTEGENGTIVFDY